MIHKSDLSRLAKKVLRHRQGIHDHQIIHPVREWLIGIAASLVILIGVGYWSVATYLSVSSRSVEAISTPTTEVVVYRAELVQAALEKFGERMTTYEELLTNRIAPPPVAPIDTVLVPEGELEISPATSTEVGIDLGVDEAASSTSGTIQAF